MNGACSIGKTCNEYGRLATCREYTGTPRRCTKHEDWDRDLVFYYDLDCPDSTVLWRFLEQAGPTDVTVNSIIKTDVEGDDECLRDDDVVKHRQTGPETYLRSESRTYLLNGRRTSVNRDNAIGAGKVPSHPLSWRGMTVYSEHGASGGEGDPPRPRIERNDQNLVDWTDAEVIAALMAAEFERGHTEDVYEVPGELLLDGLTPLSAPEVGDDTELPFGVFDIGFVVDSQIDYVPGADGATVRSKITVRR